ncbi:2-isopropylmalate synthase [Nonomuraea thailandensis]|uniref:2-isopropylmalate synthase n=1 Tax=Nonomuraea thailandensis TaxID=1188745 RepID=A0A9X2GNZ3_9ACTN|nr:2-isopropylmalate synthase [Nonomuraea thailandensis]MCP2357808.1 2-isopropylmalate synthase [Nonomuraea thailandensis]
MKASRYSSPPRIPLDGRSWPDAILSAPPRWLSTDLRDGNQALSRPMSPERKLVMFDLLVGMGYTEIEIGFPAASRDEHDFVRLLVERDLIPDDVVISVLTPAREDLIEATMASLRGASRATLHLYNATSPAVRRLVLGVNRQECKDLAVHGTHLVMKYADSLLDGCDLRFQYSPEHFNDTEPDFSLEVCEAVMDVWQPGPDRPITLNFPTTVERWTPNLFADQIEWMDRHLSRRAFRCLSVHPHNDRGTGVAAAELAMLAGAGRVEGCLFGNGERAGNVCLVTLGLNLAAQGVDPGIDFGDLDGVRRIVEECTGIAVSPRHPYGGDLVYTAFSGGHQDAIKKGFDAMATQAAVAGRDRSELPWAVPYLLVDPQDVGRTYEAVVRVNSQSGKGGAAYVMSSRYGMNLPRGLQAEFGRLVQTLADDAGGEVAPERIMEAFADEYVVPHVPSFEAPGAVATLHIDGDPDGADWTATVSSLRSALERRGLVTRVVRLMGGASVRRDEEIAVYAECELDGDTVWGVGIEPDVCAAALAAVGSSVTRARRDGLLPGGACEDTHGDAHGDAHGDGSDDGRLGRRLGPPRLRRVMAKR